MYNKKQPSADGCFLSYDFTRLIAATSRDFFRAAVLPLMIPRFAALSIALYVSGSFASASFTSPLSIAFRIFFTASFIVRERRTLNTRFRNDARSAFFAPLVIGIYIRFIVAQTIPQALKKCNGLGHLFKAL